MSTERDASSGASETVTRARRRPRLTPPPPRVVPPPPAKTAESPARPRSRSTARSAVATWLTLAFFGVLILGAIGVFVVLPDWVRARQAEGEMVHAKVAATPAETVEPPVRSEQAGRLRSQQDAKPAPVGPAVEEIAASPDPAPPRPESPRRAPQPPARAPAPAPRAAGDFEAAMTEGLAALDRGDFAAAREAFSRASGLRPGSTQSADGLARAEAGARLASIHDLRRQAEDLEASEDWHGAAERYSAVLELDPAVEFAQAGLERSRRRGSLADRLEFHLANPKRLSSDEVLQEASTLVGLASEIDPAGPEHRRRTEQLAAVVREYSTPIKATLESDQLTEVVVYKVGRLGAFSQRALDLRPGTYTVVGSRSGYRDVRRQLVIEPGVEPPTLQVRCEEKI